MARESPDINSRYVFIGARQKLKAWVLQIDAVEQKGIMPSAIKVKERYSAQQTPRPLKSKNRLRIAPQKLSEVGFRSVDPGNFASGNGYQIGQLPPRRQTNDDCGGRRKPIQLVPSG